MTVQTYEGPVEVRPRCYVGRYLAVHRAVTVDGDLLDRWTITHVPTGRAAVPDSIYLDSFSWARELAELLAAAGHWGFRQPDGFSPELRKAVRAVFAEWRRREQETGR